MRRWRHSLGFEMGCNWIGVFSHIMFGAALGLAYIALRRPNATGKGDVTLICKTGLESTTKG